MPQVTALILHDADLKEEALKAILRSTPKLEQLHVAFTLLSGCSDEAESAYHNLEPVSPVHAVQIECRLASIAILRRAVQVQDEQENGSAPPPYDPAWRETSNTARNPAVSGSPSPSLSSLRSVTTSTPTAAPCAEPTHHDKFSCDMRVYDDVHARQMYREARREAFRRYREEHGLTTWRARVANWWKDLYGGLTLEEIHSEYRTPAS
ncbi:hypothetical protein CALVIDRAFT_562717 [Calocera viscosa TUFC12733]|uniref:Uncharacterized protein n=1 Tax=Calocera viscosa (strain TUFC12733) TaxID=1330018 RepID=A0A167NL08_CALVF|nr:hypothetical protein CALVIDRAFT_562717 [Calocera viscosa TUFC12733]